MTDTPFTDASEIEYTTLAGDKIRVVPSGQARILETKLAEAEKDAERYRYWRNHTKEVDNALMTAINEMKEVRNGDELTNSEFDEAIDKAMKDE